jgi:hypothetical protein
VFFSPTPFGVVLLYDLGLTFVINFFILLIGIWSFVTLVDKRKLRLILVYKSN